MSGLRIIGGQWRGRRIQAPPGQTTRPLPDRIRQSLFDYLGQDLTDWTVADCCAGSGSFGLEAASRGATKVHLIDVDRQAQSIIRDNIEHLSAGSVCRLHRQPAAQVLATLTNLDCVFCDPPFPWFREQPADLTTLIEQAACSIAPDGLLLIRGERGYQLPPHQAPLQQRDMRQYGRSWVAVFEQRPSL